MNYILTLSRSFVVRVTNQLNTIKARLFATASAFLEHFAIWLNLPQAFCQASKQSQYTLGNAVIDYARTRSPMRSSLRRPNSYASVVQVASGKLLEYFGEDTRMVDLVRDSGKIRAFFRLVDAEKSQGYALQYRRVLIGWLLVARAHGITVPRHLIPPYDASRRQPSAPRPGVIRRLLSLVQERRPSLSVIVLVQVGAALRPVEAYALKGADISLEGEFFLVRHHQQQNQG